MVNFYCVEYINTHKPVLNMKMKIRGLASIALLAIMIMPFGAGSHAFADNHNIPPIAVTSQSPSYGNGDPVILEGKIRDYAADTAAAVTFIITDPKGGIVGIDQVTPDSDGTFTITFVAGGVLWKTNGDYTIKTTLGSQTTDTTIVYTGADSEPDVITCPEGQILVNNECTDDTPPPPPPPPPPPVPVCGPGQELIGGICIDIPPPPPPVPVCGPEQELINGICIDIPPSPVCGEGTQLVDGECVPIQVVPPTDPDTGNGPDGNGNGGTCLIATAAYGSELAPQVQFLREIRDNTVMSTASGSAFMTGFNQLYYSFSPTIADMERENPVFQEAVRAFITPMISSLSIMTLADPGSEIEVLGYGISVIMLNLGLYIAAPALIGFTVHRRFKASRP